MKYWSQKLPDNIKKIPTPRWHEITEQSPEDRVYPMGGEQAMRMLESYSR